MDRKLIFLDIDGTLLPPGGTVHPAVREGLKKVRSNGHKVFICTGRPYNVLPEGLKDVEIDGIVGSAGSDIWIGEEHVRRVSLPVELIEKACRVLDGMKSIYMLEGCDRTYVSGRGQELLLEDGPHAGDNPELARWKAFFRRRKDVFRIQDWDKETVPIPKVSFILWSREDMEYLKEELHEDFYVAVFSQVSGSLCNGELISRTDNKGTAILRVAEYLHADRKDTIAFGDSMNDYQMIEQAACGVVMGDGDEALKAIADRICEPVEEDGVIRELERMKLI